MKIIKSDFFEELQLIYKIRNFYAHEVDIKEKQITDLLNKLQKIIYNPTNRKYGNNYETFFTLSQRFIRQLQRIYLKQYTDQLELKYG